MSDPFETFRSGLNSPATKLVPIVPDDGADLPEFVRSICVASSGLVQVTTTGNTTATIFAAAGAPIPVRVRRVWATGTDATGIVGLN